VNTVSNLQGKFLNMWATISFSRRPHGVHCNHEISLYTPYLMRISGAVHKCTLFCFTGYDDWSDLQPLHKLQWIAARNVHHHTFILSGTFSPLHKRSPPFIFLSPHGLVLVPKLSDILIAGSDHRTLLFFAALCQTCHNIATTQKPVKIN
jgi:hypothetical protein